MVKITPSMWCLVFLSVMFSKEIWFSWLYLLMYLLIGASYINDPEVTWGRAGLQVGALLFIAFFFTCIVAIARMFGKDKL